MTCTRDGAPSRIRPPGSGLELTFDREVFSTVWLFGVYGGWRGHYFLLTEPCTSPPGSLADAVASGHAVILEAGEELETEVVATVFTDVDTRPQGEGQPYEIAGDSR